MNLRLYGNVKDTKTGKPIIGVSIKVYLNQVELQKGETIKNGFYEIITKIDDSRIESGQQLRVTFENTGYQTQEHHVLATEGAFNLDVSLKATNPQPKKSFNWLPVIVGAGALIILLLCGVIAWLLLSAPKASMNRHSLDAADGNPVDAIYVDDEGNVGIGRMKPDVKLHVEGEVKSVIDGVNFYMVPAGAVLPWYSKSGPIPKGWTVCNGSNGTPDLRGLFLQGTDEFNDVGHVKGKTTHTHTVPSHNHPLHSHNHTVKGRTSYEVDGTRKGPEGADNYTGSPNWNHKHDFSATTSNWSGHTGNWSGETNEGSNIPPCFTIVYIMKL